MHPPAPHRRLSSSRPLSRSALALALAAGLSACSAPEQRPIPEGAAPLGRHDTAQIKAEAETLLVELKVGEEVRKKAMMLLEEYLAAPNNATRLEAEGVNGVAAFQVGGGGIIVTGGGGEGIVSFAGGSQKVRFEVSGISIGASVGGGSNMGVLLIVGLDHEQRFPDRYTMTGTGGSYGDNTFLVASATAERGPHKLVCVATGIGFGARAGGGKITITVN